MNISDLLTNDIFAPDRGTAFVIGVGCAIGALYLISFLTSLAWGKSSDRSEIEG